MTDAQKKRFVAQSVKRLSKLFGLDHYAVKVRYRWEKNNEGSVAALPEYEQAVVNVNLELCDTVTDLAKTVLHEMVHIVNWRLYSVALDSARQMTDKRFGRKMVVEANEAVTTAWTRILLPMLFRAEG